MKPLDSLALMLALSAGVVNSISAKDSIRNEIENHRDSTAEKSTPNDSATTLQATQPEKGSFRSSQLYWSEKNKELYFKGQVRVNFKDQHFQGNGSFTFLGKVYLLFIDEQEISLGKTVRLADEDYELIMLESKDAVAKYGEKGLNGAIKISRNPTQKQQL